jgi:hypothetical protein
MGELTEVSADTLKAFEMSKREKLLAPAREA